MKIFLITLTGLCFLLACQQKPSNTSRKDSASVATVVREPDTTTLGGQWYLQPVMPSDTAAGKVPVIRFELEKSHFSGNTGCNNMSGTFWYSDSDSSLVFSDKLATTKMACPGFNEGAFIKSLLHTVRYRLKKGTLTLLADDRTELSQWARKTPVAPKANKV